MADDASVSKLREAEEALDEGDVRTARELASAALAITSASPMDVSSLHNRALRILALSFVRDPLASQEEIANAVEMLESRAKAMLPAAEPGPAFAADAGDFTGHLDEPSFVDGAATVSDLESWWPRIAVLIARATMAEEVSTWNLTTGGQHP